MSNNELREHKAKDKVKWICTAVAFVLVAVLLIGLCVQVFAPDGKKVTDWFSKTECEHTDADGDGICDNCGEEMPADNENNVEEASVAESVKNTASGKLVVSPDEVAENSANTIKLASTTLTGSTYADTSTTSYEVSVTNVVSGFTYSWSLSSGGSTYLTLSATTGTSVTVTLKKEFGSVITLTCTASYDGATVNTATCTIGYYKRPSAVYFGGEYRTDGTDIDLGDYMGYTDFINFLLNGKLDFSSTTPLTYGTGTEAFGSITQVMYNISESTSGFSYTLANTISGVTSLGSMQFSELFFRWMCANSDLDYSSSNYNTWLTQMRTLVSNGYSVPFSSLYSQISGKTFTCTMYIVNTTTLRHGTVSYTLTVPTTLTIPVSTAATSLSVDSIVF